MFGIPVTRAACVFVDNESVVKNTTRIESVLNRKHNSLAYHYVRWCVTASVLTIAWIASGENLADAFTKRLTSALRDYLFGSFTYVAIWSFSKTKEKIVGTK